MTVPQRTVVLGTLGFGTIVDEETSFRLLDHFVESGGTVLDTADNYAFWLDGATGDESEAVIGRWLASRKARDRVVISTKVGARPAVPGAGLEAAEGLSEKAVRAAVEGSLRRLGTDHVDVYWAHIEDRSVPLAETVETLADLVTSGKAGEVGASNHAVWRVERARALAGDGPRYAHLQYRYSYLQPRFDVPLPSSAHVHATPELLDYVRSEGDLRLWVYSPILSGGLTREDVEIGAAYDHPGTPKRLAALRAVAEETGASVNQVALSWLLDHEARILPLVGVSKVAQLDEALGALDLTLTAEQRRTLDEAAL
ncbi:aldo/keto reductase [Kitasatospora sp. NPDC058032]|uniref:aldo/keto reductase n=1 Tax=Kitasatospora sp. NPDC058032 TaxID=3346307 RepID=UPI0036DE57B7